MSTPNDRATFKDYILRKIGAPVIQINVSDEQVDDRVDEALSFWRDYHYDGSELVYIRHQLSAQDILDLEDPSKGYISVPERLLGVVRIFDIGSSITSGSGMFNAQYQFVLNNITDITGYSVQNYYMTMQHLQFLQEILVGKPLLRYNRHSNKLYLDKTKNTLVEGQYLIIEAYDIMDEVEYGNVWSDRWLQNYAAVLIREQWGYNLTKFTSMQLVGGVQFNGEQILSEARADRERLEEEMINKLQPLVYNFCG